MPKHDEHDDVMAALAEANPVTAGDEHPGSGMGRQQMYNAITRQPRAGRGRPWRTMAMTGGGVAAAMAVVVVAIAAMLSGGGQNGANELPRPEEPTRGSTALCFRYSPAGLQLLMPEFVFVGELTEIRGSALRFDVEEVLAGTLGSSITLRGGELPLAHPHSLLSYNDFDFVVGERYVVSGDEVFAWGCGFTREYSEEVVEEWRAVLTPPAPDNPSTSSNPPLASCAFQYSPETLRERHHAFDGEVVAVDPDAITGPAGMVYTRVTFHVVEWFTDGEGDSIALADSGMTLMEMYDPDYDGTGPVVGERYLVSGDGIFAWGCGFSRPHSEDLADEWRDAFE